MIKILGLFPIYGNGGISSWSRKFLKTFPDNKYKIIPIDNAPGPRIGTEGYAKRIISGLKALTRIRKEVIQVIDRENPTILHTTTSGSIGSMRDYIVGKICRKKGIKCIMHCRYGCIPEDLKGPLRFLLKAAMKQYDQIWVLDNRTYNILKANPYISEKIRLTPNSIEVPRDVIIKPKDYKRIGFIGNLIPTKGIFELVEACTQSNVILDIIGPGSNDVISKIKDIAGSKLDKTIFIHGKLPNEKAVEFMKELDFIALPTYFPWEAFPISILEAMSNGKLVISCPKAAIPDMLTDLSGNLCGILVKEKSAQDIRNAIKWAQDNPDQADEMCAAAYKKVKECYDTSVVYNIYRKNYQELL